MILGHAYIIHAPHLFNKADSYSSLEPTKHTRGLVLSLLGVGCIPTDCGTDSNLKLYEL